MPIPNTLFRFAVAFPAITLFVFFALPSVLFAQGLAVKVQPTTIEERVDPGGVIEGVVTVTNENGGPQTYHIGTRNINGMETSGRPVFEPEPGESDPLRAAAWIQPLVQTLLLDVGESAEVPYRIEVPKDASPGGHFAAIFVTREADTLSESGAGVGFHVASLVNLMVNGDVVEDLVVREFATPKALYTSPNAEFTVRIENTGTVHVRPVGIISITDMLGKEVGQVVVNETEGAILPRTERIWSAGWSGDGVHVGRYTAEMSVVFGITGRQTITRDTTFWVVLVRELSYILGGILVMVLVFVLGVRAYVRSVLRRAGHSAREEGRARAQASLANKLLRTVLWLIAPVIMILLAMVVFYG